MKRLEGPIGVISVAGMYRSGKSYLLNRVLLDQSRGFDVGHTINACTKVRKAVLFGAEGGMGESGGRKSDKRLVIGALKVTDFAAQSSRHPTFWARF